MLGLLRVNTICAAGTSLLNGFSNQIIQQTRNTYILKRKYPIRLYKKGGTPHKFKHRNYIYEVVENTNFRKVEPLDVILTSYVEGIGEKGDKVTLRRHFAYTNLLLPGLAVYASPENIKKYLINREEQKLSYTSKYVAQTLKYLSRCCLIVTMSIENPWVIEKWHIRANLRKALTVTTDESITLPEKEISGPNLDNEGKEFYVIITINKTEKVTMRCRLHHDSSDESKKLTLEPEYWKIPGKAIFPEDQELLDSLPRPKWEDTRKT